LTVRPLTVVALPPLVIGVLLAERISRAAAGRSDRTVTRPAVLATPVAFRLFARNVRRSVSFMGRSA
jgi:hypothetical protein